MKKIQKILFVFLLFPLVSFGQGLFTFAQVADSGGNVDNLIYDYNHLTVNLADGSKYIGSFDGGGWTYYDVSGGATSVTPFFTTATLVTLDLPYAPVSITTDNVNYNTILTPSDIASQGVEFTTALTDGNYIVGVSSYQLITNTPEPPAAMVFLLGVALMSCRVCYSRLNRRSTMSPDGVSRSWAFLLSLTRSLISCLSRGGAGIYKITVMTKRAINGIKRIAMIFMNVVSGIIEKNMTENNFPG